VGLVLLGAAHAGAQAWTPPKGGFAFTTTYQYLNATDHLLSDPVLLDVDLGTTTVDFGTAQSQVLVLDGDFGVTDRLALNAAIAFVSSRYLEGGIYPFGPVNAEGPLDDGDWNSSFQDARIGVRYTAFDNGEWLLTPAAWYGFPTTEYATLGHSAIGRRLKEFRLGLNWGRLLSFSGRRKAYIQGNYSYAFMESTDDVSLDRSNLLVEFGYFLNKHLTLQAWTDYQNIHGGLDGTDLDAHHHDFAGIFQEHDRGLASDFWRLGGGVAVPVNDSVTIYGNVATMLWGINTQQTLSVTIGMSWGFQIIGSRGLGIWEQQDDANADMDDWLLEGLADAEVGDGNASQGEAR
jgi:hypothetical protein